MASIQYYDVIIRPVITEKSMADMVRRNIHSLYIRKLTKTQIKEAVRRCSREQKLRA